MDQAKINLSHWLGTSSQSLNCQREKYKRRLEGHLENTPSWSRFRISGLGFAEKVKRVIRVSFEGQWIQKQRGSDSDGGISATVGKVDAKGKSWNCRNSWNCWELSEQPGKPTQRVEEADTVPRGWRWGFSGGKLELRSCQSVYLGFQLKYLLPSREVLLLRFFSVGWAGFGTQIVFWNCLINQTLI